MAQMMELRADFNAHAASLRSHFDNNVQVMKNTLGKSVTQIKAYTNEMVLQVRRMSFYESQHVVNCGSNYYSDGYGSRDAPEQNNACDEHSSIEPSNFFQSNALATNTNRVAHLLDKQDASGDVVIDISQFRINESIHEEDACGDTACDNENDIADDAENTKEPTTPRMIIRPINTYTVSTLRELAQKASIAVVDASGKSLKKQEIYDKLKSAQS